MGDVQLDGDDAGADVKGSGLAGPAVDAGTPAGELVGEVFSQPAVGSGDERRGLRQIHALAPWFAGEGHPDLLQGSVPGVRSHRTLRLLRTRRMILAGPPRGWPAGRCGVTMRPSFGRAGSDRARDPG